MRLPHAALLPMLLLAPITVFAHAHLESSIPPTGSTSSTPPKEVTINYTEGVEPESSTIEVQTAAGVHVEDGKPHTAQGDNTQLVIGLKALEPGTSTVTWPATAVDTHKTQGTFTFAVAL
jgi:methionine-rich copper-binding protein CopC